MWNEKKKEEKQLPYSDKVHRQKNFNDFLNAITWSVVSLLLIFVVMLYMTQIDGSGGINLKAAAIETAILYLISTSIALLMRSYAKRKGKITPQYIKAFETIERINDFIVAEDIANKITPYCRHWEETELASAREHVLSDAGIKLAEFNEKYLKYSRLEIVQNYPELTDYEYKTICRAKRVKRLHFNENYLNVYDKSGRRTSPSGHMTVKTRERLSILRVMLLALFGAFLGVYVTVQLITDFSFATVVMCMVKLATILISGVTNMISGYNMYAVHAVEEMNAKINEQNRFIKWCGIELPPADNTKQ